MKTGAIVGRFQVPELHKGHIHLIDEVLKRSDILLIILGYPPAPDDRNILSVKVRMEMIEERYPFAIVYSIEDQGSNYSWSSDLDCILDERPNVTLYHSRDSFKERYEGKYPCIEIPELPGYSGTFERESITAENNVHYRQGLIDGFNIRSLRS